MSDYDGISEDAFARALGSEVRFWRTRLRISREDLAKAAGISASTLGRIERADEEGALDVGVAWRLGRALGLGFGELVRRAEDTARMDAATAAGAADAVRSRVAEHLAETEPAQEPDNDDRETSTRQDRGA